MFSFVMPTTTGMDWFECLSTLSGTRVPSHAWKGSGAMQLLARVWTCTSRTMINYENLRYSLTTSRICQLYRYGGDFGNLMGFMDTSPRWELRTTIHYSPVLDTFRWKVPIITGGFRTYWGSSYRFFVSKVNRSFCLSLPHVENIQPFGRELSPLMLVDVESVCVGPCWPHVLILMTSH